MLLVLVLVDDGDDDNLVNLVCFYSCHVSKRNNVVTVMYGKIINSNSACFSISLKSMERSRDVKRQAVGSRLEGGSLIELLQILTLMLLVA